MLVTTTDKLLLPRERIAIPIYLDEWEELVGRVESCRVSLQPWPMVYSIAFAVGATAGLSILPIAFADLPSWVMTVYIVICSLGIGVGAVCTIAERKFAKLQHAQIDGLGPHGTDKTAILGPGNPTAGVNNDHSQHPG